MPDLPSDDDVPPRRTRRNPRSATEKPYQFDAQHFAEQIASDREAVEALLATGTSANCIRTLVNRGCDRLRIVTLLAAMRGHFVPPRWAGLGDRAALNAAVATITNAAQVARNVLSVTNFLSVLQSEVPEFGLFRLLPMLLEDFGDLLRMATDEPGDLVRAFLVAYVHDRTGDFFDTEVAELIASVKPQSGGYNADAHRHWRTRHQADIDGFTAERLAEFEPGFPLKSG